MILKNLCSFGFIICCITCLLLFFSLQQAFAAGVIFEHEEYGLHEKANIIVHDPDRNKNPGVPEIFPVKVTSDTSPEGHLVLVVETSKNSGFFIGAVEFTKVDNDKRKLQVSIDDRIYIDYGILPDVAKIIGKPLNCGPDMLTLNDFSCITKFSLGLNPDVDFEVKTFQKKYYKGETIGIYGFTSPDSNETKISLRIIDPSLNTILSENVSINVADQFIHEVETTDKIWDVMGDYTLEAEFGTNKSSTGFELRRSIIPEDAQGKILIMPGTNEPGCQTFGECFLPTKLEISVGEEVTWMNSDPKFEHVLVSGNEFTGPDGLFTSPSLEMGEKFSFQFNQTGNYTYFDSVHPWMIGLVQVKEIHQITDNVPPMILLPENMTVNAETKFGTKVNFTAKAVDDVDGILDPKCTHESGGFFPIGKTIIKCIAEDEEVNLSSRFFSINVVLPKTIIPDWIKELAALWCNDEIKEYSFLEAIQYLIDNEVIVVEFPEDSKERTNEIPSWIKENACWWSKGEISDDEFADGLKFLVSHGIIII